MTIIDLIVVLVLLGLVLGLILLIPMDATIGLLIRTVVIIAAVLYVLQWLGFISGLPLMHVPFNYRRS